MRVARVEPERDAAAHLVEHDVLGPDRPLACKERVGATVVSRLTLRGRKLPPRQ